MPDSTSITLLDQAIAGHPFRPKGIKVGSDLWKALVAAGRIKWKRGFIEGIIDSKINFPVLDEDIFVHVDPELGDYGYELQTQVLSESVIAWHAKPGSSVRGDGEA